MRPVRQVTLNAATVRVMGSASGPHAGTFTLSENQKSLTFLPTNPFLAGEVVTGSFGAPSFFDGGVSGVVAGRDGSHLRILLTQGDGTFAYAGPAVWSGGRSWIVQLGDLNSDGHLDVSCANSNSFSGSILLGDGARALGAPAIMTVGSLTVSTDLGDLDGDGDLDWVLSSFGGGFWRVYTNGGAGTFVFDQQIPAPSNPSCAALFDADGDGHLDMALTDEIADVILLMNND